MLIALHVITYPRAYWHPDGMAVHKSKHPKNIPNSKQVSKTLNKYESSSNRDFNGHTSVNPMLIIQINRLHPKPLQTSFTTSPNILRISANLPHTIILNPKLSSQLHLPPHSSL
ncbi:hypothetical protein HanPI659440_Chr15g0603761 [Helianthus annuus]|nr:hypothetical protein HanIR_Chr15g0766401 [Helianthus annuus]KAJ0693998.1 hypothetical protein HanPI659440_Chr15g0603761 [Helianthus annuus]